MATAPPLLELPIKTAEASFYSGFSKHVTITTKMLIGLLIVLAVIFPNNAASVLNSLKAFSLENFGAWYVWVVAFYVIVCIACAIVPNSGKLLLGRPGDTPEFLDFS